MRTLLVGMVLVTLVLLVFLNNVRCALIVAMNIPLALLFAFALLYLRGRSANLLSLGAVDFGIIVDSSVIMVECIFRRLSAGQDRELDIQHRILQSRRRGAAEPVLFHVDHGLRAVAAVPDDGPGRPDFRPDGGCLRLRLGRRAASGADVVAGAVPDVFEFRR